MLCPLRGKERNIPEEKADKHYLNHINSVKSHL
jgi:hypothetical protein